MNDTDIQGDIYYGPMGACCPLFGLGLSLRPMIPHGPAPALSWWLSHSGWGCRHGFGTAIKEGLGSIEALPIFRGALGWRFD